MTESSRYEQTQVHEFEDKYDTIRMDNLRKYHPSVYRLDNLATNRAANTFRKNEI